MAVQVEQLITQHLDLWTQAQTAKSTSGRGSNNKIELTGIKKLRELILELAVRGKLVPQDPNDEPASELLERIAAEKEALVKAGKLKKQKPLPPITDEEKPFELPDGWEWARLGYTATYGSSVKAESNDANENTWVLELEDIEKETSRLIQKVRFTDREFKSTKSQFGIGNVLYGKLRPYLDKVIVADEPGVCTTEIIPISCYGNFSPYYLRWMLKTPRFIRYADESTHGMNMPRLGTDKGEMALVAVAPVSEQNRIVAKVDELMVLCDQLEQQSYHQLYAHNQLVDALLVTLTESKNADELASNWQRLAAHFDTLFTTEYSVSALKQTILQLAVMGKLCNQDPNDEPASELLKRIAFEKDALVKAGKIKKQKPLPPISEDEKPFELPEGWEWCRLADIASFENGDRSSRYPNSNDLVSDGIPFFGAYDIKDAKLAYSDQLRYITEKKFAELSNGKLTDGDFVMLLRGSVGKTAQFLATEFFSTGFINAQMLIIRLVNRTLDRYIPIYFDSVLFKNQILISKSGAVIQQIPASKISELIVPLPPISTVSRITKINSQLFQICDALAQRINSSEQVQAVLADVLVEQVVA